MKRKNLTIWIMVVCLIGLRDASAMVYFANGETNIIDYLIDDDVEVQNGFGDTTTTLNLVTGGYITGKLSCRIYDDSIVNIFDGQVDGNIESGGNGPITMWGGKIGGKWFQHNGYGALYGGLLDGNFEILNLADAIISGGQIGGNIIVANDDFDDSILTIYGYDFSIDGESVGYGTYVNTGEHFDGEFYTDGILTGYLANGEPINNYYKIYGDASIILVLEPPEPAAGDLLVCMPIYDGVSRYYGSNGEYLGDFISPGYGGLDRPTGITFGPDGNLYVGNEETDSILRYDGKTGLFIDEFVPSGSGNLHIPRTILFGPDGNLYVADEGIDTVLQYNGQTGDFMGIFTSGYTLDSPFGMAFGPDDNLYVTTIQTDQVVRFNGNTGEYINEFLVNNVYTNRPAALVFGPDSNLYLADSEQNEITRYDGHTGEFIDKFITSGSGGLTIQEGNLLFGPDGNLYVAGGWTKILRYDGQTGAFIDVFVSADPTWVSFFVFVPEPIQLLQPNGDESLTSGKAYPVKWASAGYISEVLIEYSVDNGASWTAVTPPNVGNNGLYNWLVPAVDSNQCLVRVSDSSDPNVSDTSDDAFTIKQPVAGSIVAWGYNYQGDSNVPAGNDFVGVISGYDHGFALRSNGTLAGWGEGDCDVPEGTDFAAIAPGLALRYDGSLARFGCGDPYVPEGNDFVAISVYGFTVALRTDGSLLAWGNNEQGQVTKLPLDKDFVAIAADCYHGVAIRTDGSLTAWGSSSYDRLDVPAGNDFVDVTTGYGHGVALRSDGTLAVWGRDWYGNKSNAPTGNDFVAIAGGYDHSLALKSEGSIVAWGRNDNGQCDMPDGNNFVGIAALGEQSFALVQEIVISGYIDWIDLGAFCDRWLESGCSDVNDWCGRADINRSSVVDSVDYSWLAKYWGSIAPEPNAAGHPEPDDAATEVSITSDLSWAAGEDTAAHGVYFGISPTLDANDFQGYQTGAIFNPGTMAADTTYYWQVDEVGLGGETSGDVWSFTTAPVPGKAYNPSPGDLASNININHNLSWTANFYTTSHDVYFGTNPTPGAGEFEGNQISTTFDPGTLDYDTTYYWRVDGVGPGGITAGVIWSFTTEATPIPGQAGNPVPANMATDVNTTTCLNWSAGVNTQSHDVYFGTSSPGDFKGNQIDTTFCPLSSLEYNTTYYWRIDEKNPYNTTTGEVWSFTTMVDPNLVGWWKFDETSGVIAYDSSGNGNHGQLVDGLGNGLVWAPAEGALNFDGSNNLSRVVVSTVGMSTTEGTIAFWANLAEPQNRGDGRNGSGYFFGCDNGVKDRILLYMDNSNTQLDVRIGDHSESNIITLGTLVWYHIALSWNGGSYVVYLNGIVMSAGAYDGLTTLPSTADIGNNGGSYKQSFHGLMGDVQVYDKSISTTDILQYYQDVAN